MSLRQASPPAHTHTHTHTHKRTKREIGPRGTGGKHNLGCYTTPGAYQSFDQAPVVPFGEAFHDDPTVVSPPPPSASGHVSQATSGKTRVHSIGAWGGDVPHHIDTVLSVAYHGDWWITRGLQQSVLLSTRAWYCS